MTRKSKNIAERMEEMVKENETKNLSVNARKLVIAHDTSNKLAAKGVFQKRGYTLRGIEDMHLLQSRPNC